MQQSTYNPLECARYLPCKNYRREIYKNLSKIHVDRKVHLNSIEVGSEARFIARE